MSIKLHNDNNTASSGQWLKTANQIALTEESLGYNGHLILSSFWSRAQARVAEQFSIWRQWDLLMIYSMGPTYWGWTPIWTLREHSMWQWVKLGTWTLTCREIQSMLILVSSAVQVSTRLSYKDLFPTKTM